MPDYSKGKIYKLIGNGMIYYGSTIQTLAQRKTTHKSHPYNEIAKSGNFIMELVELYPCNSKKELFERERYWIDNNECINKIKPITTDEEKRLNHIERQNRYRSKNPERVKEIQRKCMKCRRDKQKEIVDE